MHDLELARLGLLTDTSLFSRVSAAQGSLTAFEDCSLGADLLLGLLVRHSLLDTRISARLASTRGESSVLLDRSGDRSGSAFVRLVFE